MTRKFTGNELVVATHNQGKVKELHAYLADYVDTLYSAEDMNLEDVEETETTFIGNAKLKALAAAKATGKIALADDSGFAVTALNGDPGVYSARWAGEPRDFNMAMGKVHDLIKDEEDQSAKFVCTIVMAWPDGHCEYAEGAIEGHVTWPPRGDKGFGYDPMFVPNGTDRTFAEIPAEEKRADSHRTRALNGIVDLCFKA